MIKFGVYSIVVPDYPMEEAAQKVAEAGYTGIEWTVGYPKAVWDGTSEWHVSETHLEDDAKKARDVAAKYGLETPALGTRCQSGEFDRIKRLMAAAKVMNCGMVRVSSAGYDGKTHYNDLFKKVRKDYETVQKLAADSGVRAAIEIHGRTIAPSASAMRRLLDGFDPKLIGATFDPGNMVHEGMENWKMGIEILGEYLVHFHVKDYGWFRDKNGKWSTQPMSLADGLTDWPLIFRTLKAVGYDGYMNLEDFRGGYCCRPQGITTVEKLAECIKYQKETLSAVEKG